MILRFLGLGPGDLLASTCPGCKACTVHGFVGQLKWIAGDSPATLRPVAFCGGCLLPWEASFSVEEVGKGSPSLGEPDSEGFDRDLEELLGRNAELYRRLADGEYWKKKPEGSVNP